MRGGGYPVEDGIIGQVREDFEIVFDTSDPLYMSPAQCDMLDRLYEARNDVEMTFSGIIRFTGGVWNDANKRFVPLDFLSTSDSKDE